MIDAYDVHVTCDFCGNEDCFEFRGPDAPSNYNARLRLAEEGWPTDPDGRHRCPDCVSDEE